jgi:hypothetical protein
MTATKAVAGGVAANIVTVVLWGISNIPGWNAVPDEPRAAIIGLVSGAVAAAIVYFAPANQQTLVTAAAPKTRRELDGSPRFSAALAGTTD